MHAQQQGPSQQEFETKLGAARKCGGEERNEGFGISAFADRAKLTVDPSASLNFLTASMNSTEDVEYFEQKCNATIFNKG